MTPGHPALLTSSEYGLVLQKGQGECVCLTFKVSPEKQGGQSQLPRPPSAVPGLALDSDAGKGNPVGIQGGLDKNNETPIARGEEGCLSVFEGTVPYEYLHPGAPGHREGATQ